MKKTITIALSIFAVISANAQNASSSASQATQLSLANAVDITFTGSGTNNGGTLNFPFSTISDYQEGVTSALQTLKVRSNKTFGVTVKTNSASFSYTGAASPAPNMPVGGTLKLKVNANNTGGSIGGPFSSTAFKTLSSNDKNLIVNGTNGGNQTFDIQYEATPGFNYPAGEYSVNVIYTVSQQ